MGLHFTTQKSIEPSFAERLIIKQFKARKINFYREVQFDYCRNLMTGGKLRYDFYLPAYNLLIEYDGAEYHQDFEVQIRDSTKDKFAQDNNIRLIRLSAISQVLPFFEITLKEIIDKGKCKAKITTKERQDKQKRAQWQQRLQDEANETFKKIDYIPPKNQSTIPKIDYKKVIRTGNIHPGPKAKFEIKFKKAPTYD